MRLIKASSVELEEFQPSSVPQYAILSHRWGDPDDEVLFHDIGTRFAKSKKAYQKVLNACQQAQVDGYEYVWIDTCCIDKSSSAELSEAINSMFRWYQNSAVCYAFLPDVSRYDGGILHAPGLGIQRSFQEKFASSSWFTRGWTLQELLAPPKVVFFDDQWREIGTKSRLGDQIFKATGIGVGFLEGWTPISSASIAQRMSWMANRKTTRPEDTAYCLLGIFSVNMPLLYGEGDRAFIRLQEEIMKHSYDHSIFAWMDYNMGWKEPCGILASSPRYFRDTRTIIPRITNNEPYTMTNRGLRLSVPLQRLYSHALPGSPGNLYIALNCVDARWPVGSNKLVAIEVAPTQSNATDFVRVGAYALTSLLHWSTSTLDTIYVRSQLETSQNLLEPIKKHCVRLKSLADPKRFNLTYSKATQNGVFQPVFENTIIKIPQNYSRTACAMLFECKITLEYILITIGSNFPPRFRLGYSPSSTTSKDLQHIAFDAQSVDDILLNDDILEVAKKLFTPHTIGMELFMENFAVSVRHAAEDCKVFDPTISQITISIRELTSTSRRPINGAKWQIPAVLVTTMEQELMS